MTKDNILFATCGFLLGLILGGVMVGPKIVEWRRGPDPVAATASPAAAQAPTDPGGAATMAMVREKIDRLKARIAENPKDTAALTELGNLYMDAAMYSQALGYYEQSVAVRRDPAILMDLGICYRETGAPEKALATFREVTRLSPESWQSQFNEAIVLADMQRIDEARRIVARLEREHPGDANLLRFKKSLSASR